MIGLAQRYHFSHEHLDLRPLAIGERMVQWNLEVVAGLLQTCVQQISQLAFAISN